MADAADVLDGTESPEVALTRLVESEGDRLYSLSLRFCGHREEADRWLRSRLIPSTDTS